jgi:hypothetical protein
MTGRPLPSPKDAGPLPDGVYFGLPAARYHAEHALGSTSTKELLGDPSEFWWNSWLNPARPSQEPTPAQILGTAVHTYVLDGPFEFRLHYVRRPDDVERLTKELKSRLAPNGETILAGDDFDRVIVAGKLIKGKPTLATAFTGGMPEVSVLWTDTVDGEPVRRKARFDYLKPAAVVDLKSHRPTKPIPFGRSCRRNLVEFDYPIQAASYLEARALLPQFVADGAVYGDHDPAWLREVAETEAFAFVWIFWASAGAPRTWGGYVSPGNPILDVAAAEVRNALVRFVDLRRRYGAEVAWIEDEPLSEIDISELPPWFGRARD